ncbi:MAG: cysteine desulfurase family protein [Ruminococcus sp.]|nr:cysteine desulfurase family protein [Ruminococcus sp.]
MVYLDNAATTKPSAAVCSAVMSGLENFGNPSSLHKAGLNAELSVSRSREIIASALGCTPEEIFFTSGATESNNTAIFGAYKAQGKRRKRVVTTTVEHPAVARPVDELEKLGCEVVRISPDENGKFSARDIFSAVNGDTFLVSCMLVNNETGAVLPVEKAFSMIKKKYPEVITHCDCVQGFMKLPVKTKKLCADMLSVSGHKIYAPKGIGALYVRKGLHIPPFMLGGGQEKGFRSGTESVPLICGFGAAVEELMYNISENLEKMRELEKYLFEKCAENGEISVNYAEDKSPYVNSISVKDLKSEVLLHFLEERGVYVSSGSACSKGKKSGVLQEFRIPAQNLDTTIRVSFSVLSSKEDVDRLIEGIEEAQKKLARLKP